MGAEWWREKKREREREIERIPTYCCIPQLSATAEAGPGQSQGFGSQSGSQPAWKACMQVLGPS